MGIIYFGVITPTGLLMKIFGKDLLGLKKNKNNSYWIKKDYQLYYFDVRFNYLNFIDSTNHPF